VHRPPPALCTGAGGEFDGVDALDGDRFFDLPDYGWDD
jgi:hypothetical protein